MTNYQQPTCSCFASDRQEQAEVYFHTERQDVTCDAWKRLLDLVEEAAADGREEFEPIRNLGWDKAPQIVTLPPTIDKLKAVKRLGLYGTHLVRIPPEIGGMTSLEFFDPYTSWRLHWLPYDITRCANLRMSRVSTRKLYGNFKYRPPFPALPVGQDSLGAILDAVVCPNRFEATKCSICDKAVPVSGLTQRWLSLLVATDVVPLLVNACSQTCLDTLPPPHPDYVQSPHTGGPGLEQPPTQW